MATGTSPSPSGRKTEPLARFFDELQKQKLCVPSRQMVEDYLIEHQDLTSAVLHACQAARKQFAEPVELSLEVYCDPETRDRSLVLNVRQQPYHPGIIHQIEELSEPLADELSQASGFFFITTDFRLPGCKRVV